MNTNHMNPYNIPHFQPEGALVNLTDRPGLWEVTVEDTGEGVTRVIRRDLSRPVDMPVPTWTLKAVTR